MKIIARTFRILFLAVRIVERAGRLYVVSAPADATLLASSLRRVTDGEIHAGMPNYVFYGEV
jgi:hypothetical protein